MQEAVANMRKAQAHYIQKQVDWEKAKEASLKAENSEPDGNKTEKRRKTEDEAMQKVSCLLPYYYYYLYYSYYVIYYLLYYIIYYIIYYLYYYLFACSVISSSCFSRILCIMSSVV